ncbi:MAG: hypothetical protein ACYC4P_10645 [Thermoanaerobaculia bacterium]
MTKARVAGGVLAAALLLLALVFVVRHRAVAPGSSSRATPTIPTPSATAEPMEERDAQGFLYGRVTTLTGATWEGRLRWGGGQEAFWGDAFNGRKVENRWAAHVPADRLPRERRGLSLFGLEIGRRERPASFVRLFMARFGDLSRIEAHGGRVRVTLKSGAVVDLDRLEASDFDDGIRVWDARRGMVDLDSTRIRVIELLPGPSAGPVPTRLQGTVTTRQGDFRGFLQWDREKCVGTDELVGRTAEGVRRIRFDTIRALARSEGGGLLVTLLDGREIALDRARGTSGGSGGTYVDDPRFGRVLVSREAFERIDFVPGGSGPAYGDFPPGEPLSGSVSVRDGRRLSGRLVYDLDESESTETLDAPSAGVDYMLPFGLVASIVLPAPAETGEPRARVALHTGEELRLELAGDLGARNAGLLVFAAGRAAPEYVSWADVARIDLDRPKAVFPPPGGRDE